MKFSFIKPTVIFGIIGIFIPGFTAIGVVGFQMFLTFIGIECSKAWTIINFFSVAAVFILPYMFYNYIDSNKFKSIQSLKSRLNLFNLLEYTLIQISLASLMTNGKTLCYSTDGQNGLELVFTAWLSIPVLIIFSVILDYTFKITE